METRKQAIIEALARFIRQRPGLEFGNYGDAVAYRAECRSIAKDKREAQTLLTAVSWRDGIDADALIKAAEGAFSGRLTIRELEWRQFAPTDCPGMPCSVDCDHRQFRGFAVEYVTGQYWPTEYRRAVCAVLASALWTYTRDTSMPQIGAAPCGSGKAEAGKYFDGKRAVSAGDWLRAHFRKEFGRGIASRWFS